MTETRRWLEARRVVLLRRYAVAVAMRSGGLVCGALAVGLLLDGLGLYRVVPPAVLLGWLGAVAAVGLGAALLHRAARAAQVPQLARVVEVEGARRRGSVAGPAAWGEGGAASTLAAHADGQVAGWLATEGDATLARPRRESGRALRTGSATLVAGAVLLGAALPSGSAFWAPWSVLFQAEGAVRLTVDRTEVHRGEHVTAHLEVRGRRSADLSVRAPGEPWATRTVPLDTAGRAAVPLGALESDRFLRAASGARTSETVHVRVQLPALLASLELVARFPDYLARPDEPLAPGEAPLPLPVGTRILTRGRATVDLAGAAWRSGDRVRTLATEGPAFEGELAVRAGGRWELALTTAAGPPLESHPPVLALVALADSNPVVQMPVPGRDTVAPLSLRQALLIDARDDHGIARAALISWRVSRLGVRGDADTTALPLPAGGTDRAVLHRVLDLNGRGFLPGDTAYLQAAAWDNAPTPHRGTSEVYALRLPEVSELRRQMRGRSRTLGEAADSLVTDQDEVTRRLEDLAAERERSERREEELRRGAPPADQLPFEAAERAREALATEEGLVARAEALREELRELAEAAWAAGVTDPAFHAEMQSLQELLERALSAELGRRLDALREALARLDASDVRDALRQLATSADRLREDLRRSRELFERAAVEGELTTLAQDADELAARQRDWNASVDQGADSTLATVERALADRADSLASEVAQLDRSLARAAEGEPGRLEAERERAAAAADEMRDAAASAERRARSAAREAGEAAREQLDPLAQELREERDAMRRAWREEVMQQLDRAMVESAELARRQAEIGARLERGEAGANLRGSQAALREGLDRLLERLRSAAGKNALVSPQLGSALGVAQDRMGEALDELQQASPNTRQAGASAGQALDALNGLVYALLESRAQVSGASSGSGLQEAIEQLAELANQQGALSGSAGSMLSSLPASREELLQQLAALAARQRGLAGELDYLRAGGEVSGADQLAEEAREIARLLEQGQLTRELVERQQRLFRRLLDAGRTLQSDEEDERRERVSESAQPGNVRRPETTNARGAAVRFRYPTWEELQRLSAEERRLILEYFRRLNGGGR